VKIGKIGKSIGIFPLGTNNKKNHYSMKFYLTILFLFITSFIMAQQNNITNQDNDYIVRKGNDTTFCHIKRISRNTCVPNKLKEFQLIIKKFFDIL